MKKILLVDDDDYKIANIKSFLEEEKDYDIAIENALNPGLRRLLKEKVDLIQRKRKKFWKECFQGTGFKLLCLFVMDEHLPSDI